MHNYRMIAIDLDDTLLTKDLTISPLTKETLRRARAAGVHVTLATGRMFQSALPYARELELNLPLITYQGALVKEAITGEKLLHLPVPLDLAREVISQVAPHFHTNLYVDDNLYVEKLTPEAVHYGQVCRVAVHPVGDLLKFLDQAPTKVLAVGKEDELDQLKQEMQRHFGDALHLTKSKPHFLEFSHPLATKGHALDMLARRWGIGAKQVIAIGDSENDLEMLDYAGLGVVMGNARPGVQARADYVTGSNDQDGVAEVITRFVLEE